MQLTSIYGPATDSSIGLVKPDGSTITVTSSGAISASSATAVKRRWVAVFTQNLLTSTGIDLTQPLIAPDGSGNSSISWTPKIAYLYTQYPGSGATSAQVVYGASGNAAFGSGTNILSSALSVSGSSTYEASTTSMAAVTVASGTPVAADWTGLSGQNTVLQIEFEATF